MNPYDLLSLRLYTNCAHKGGTNKARFLTGIPSPIDSDVVVSKLDWVATTAVAMQDSFMLFHGSKLVCLCSTFCVRSPE